jgi:hypothetical protein
VISIEDLRLIADLFRDSDPFILIDAIATPLEIFEVYPRPWAKGGYVPVPLEISPDDDDFVDSLNDRGFPIAFVEDEDSAKLPNVEALKLALFERIKLDEIPIKVIKNRPGRGLINEGRRLRQTLPITDRSTTIILKCEQEHQYPRIDLPYEVDAELMGQKEHEWLVGIDGESRNGEMPTAAWYRLGGGGQGTLTIDIIPDVNGDHWDVSYSGGTAELTFPPALDDCQLPEHIAVILDRTCPDEAHWSDARALVMGGVQQSSFDAPDDSLSDASVQTNYRDYNSGIRIALAQVLAEALQGVRTVHGFWFADTAYGGVTVPAGIDTPADFAAATLPVYDLETIANLFHGTTYTPGLDLWDHLEEGFRLALAWLTQNSGTGGILIVGNSPPNLPVRTEDTSPFHQVAKHFGFMTSYRKDTMVWEQQIESYKNEGIPVVYLFLEHHKFNPEESEQHGQFITLQTKVAEALGKSIPLIRGSANESGIRKGVEDALKILKRFSSVRIIQR